MIDQKDADEQHLAAIKASTLIESLPWLQRFHGETFVIKFGGNAMTDPALLDAFAQDVVYLSMVGIRPVVVHGGGPQITRMLERLDIASEFRGGYRYTSPEALDVVRMVLTGQVSRDIVGRINRHGPIAVAISGEDAGLFTGARVTTDDQGEPLDLGLVGEVVAVDPTIVQAQLDAGRVPVVSSIAPDGDHPEDSLNVNADAAAASLAVALGAAKLVLLTNVPGLYRNWPDTSSLISSLTASELTELLPGLASGMIPKMRACLDAVEGGVDTAAVVDGRVPHSVLLEIFTDRGIGTEVTATAAPELTATPETKE
ncbi:acetylglutamate kinase [Pseudoclavibacter soli]|uniref:acetylglutamate kinase n=1 Tax=Pseudoclavibacter soli TaxID=452623 RepID=UPI0004242FD5|nr:acetylglutamate kinase [Pseudoclavibacter soli]